MNPCPYKLYLKNVHIRRLFLLTVVPPLLLFGSVVYSLVTFYHEVRSTTRWYFTVLRDHQSYD